MGDWWPTVLAAGAGAGVGFGAGGGGKGGDSEDLQKQLLHLAQQQGAGAGNLLGETALLRKLVLAPMEATLLGMRPTQLPIFAPARETLEKQFGTARTNILSQTPTRGGQLNEGLMNLETDRARSLAGLDADIAQSMFQTGAQVGFGAPGVAFGGMSGAAQSLGQLAAQASAQETGKGAGVGGLMGNMLMAAALKPKGK